VVRPGVARAQPKVDQQTSCTAGGSFQILAGEPAGQLFTPLAPNLVAIEVFLDPYNPPFSDNLTMVLHQGDLSGPAVAGVTRSVAGTAPAWVRFDLPSPATVVPGTPYALELVATNTSWGWRTNFESPPSCSYPAGEEILSGAPVAGLDAMFRTYTLCGNGTLDPGEQCDDGNDDPSDGCTNHCTVCGDGIVEAPEQCDDHNLVNGDGCDANCTRTGCGNGIVTAGEACDDGNRLDGDCCSSTCQFDRAGAACLDDANPCTDDVCDGAGACTHPANAAPCSDGIACNGPDTCAGGTCSVHAGNPCATRPECRRDCLEGSFGFTCVTDPAGTACSGDGDSCTTDACDGGGTCTHVGAPDGTPCSDGDACTTGDACSGGHCRAGAPLSCGPCLVCGAGGTCVPPPAPGCTEAASGLSSIVFHNDVNSTRDVLRWKWAARTPIAKADFGNPMAGTDLTLCVYDATGFRLAATAPGGGACAGIGCWASIPGAYRYRDPELTPNGLSKLMLRGGGAATAKIVARGRGTNLDMPPLGLAPPVVVRLRRDDGPACWEARYSAPLQDNAVLFRATSD
jgi:cysteine-rich repeat protein